MEKDYDSETYKKMKRGTLNPFDKSALAYYQSNAVADIEQSAPAASRLSKFRRAAEDRSYASRVGVNIQKRSHFDLG